jgi:hypothetical protein
VTIATLNKETRVELLIARKIKETKPTREVKVVANAAIPEARASKEASRVVLQTVKARKIKAIVVASKVSKAKFPLTVVLLQMKTRIVSQEVRIKVPGLAKAANPRSEIGKNT